MINVFNNAMLLFDHYKDEYGLTTYDKLILGLAALFHDFNHSGGKLKDSENIELALASLKEFIDTITKSDMWYNRKMVNMLVYNSIEKIITATDNIKGVSVLPFTIGKVYETTGEPPAQYRIISDTGIPYDLSTRRFVTLEEWREMQLKKIL